MSVCFTLMFLCSKYWPAVIVMSTPLHACQGTYYLPIFPFLTSPMVNQLSPGCPIWHHDPPWKKEPWGYMEHWLQAPFICVCVRLRSHPHSRWVALCWHGHWKMCLCGLCLCRSNYPAILPAQSELPSPVDGDKAGCCLLRIKPSPLYKASSYDELSHQPPCLQYPHSIACILIADCAFEKHPPNPRSLYPWGAGESCYSAAD